MITLKSPTSKVKHVVKPTQFPDGTTQVWKLPEWVFTQLSLNIIWNFESESEVMHLASLVGLLCAEGPFEQKLHLHMPFLPYGRQDKEVTNASTFNLRALAEIINMMKFSSVTTVDAHNPILSAQLFFNFKNIEPTEFQEAACRNFQMDAIVFPDKGAQTRYPAIDLVSIAFDKIRNQETGVIEGHSTDADLSNFREHARFLIVDDLCDGGATFISVAKTIRAALPLAHIGLCVTHGVFSRGKQHLLANGIDELFTTNSLPQNEEGYPV